MSIGAYILSTGTELARGKSNDTNGPYLAQHLDELGFEILGLSILTDSPDVLEKTIRYLLNLAQLELIILTGGLGPTQDDLTVDVLAKLFEREIIEDQRALKASHLFLKNKQSNQTNLKQEFHLELSIEQLRRQVRIPRGAKSLANPLGLAPGFLLDWQKEAKLSSKAQSFLLALPGVPREMKAIFENEFSKIVSEKFHKLEKQVKERARTRRTFYIYDLGESTFQKVFLDLLAEHNYVLSDILSDRKYYFKDSSANIAVNLLWGVSASLGYLKIFLEMNGIGANAELERIFQLIKGKYLASFLAEDISLLFHKLCLRENIQIGTAESCTGGGVAQMITDISGSSAYFKGSLVSYANELKLSHLGVPTEILDSKADNKGAVSAECALAMAHGLIKAFNLDFALAISGIAGPSGGTATKPVGTVFIALASSAGSEVCHKIYAPLNHRADIRAYSARLAMFYFYKFILGSSVNKKKL